MEQAKLKLPKNYEKERRSQNVNKRKTKVISESSVKSVCKRHNQQF